LLLDENGLGHDAARTQESGERSDDMKEKDDESAHLNILAERLKLQELGSASNSPETRSLRECRRT
jgi:hypothetical protein